MIKLKRTIMVKSFEVSGTIALGEKRPEFLAIARLAADHSGILDAKTIQRELFGNMPEQVGRLVMDRCLALGLLEGNKDRATLSDNGKLALEKGEILVSQEGEWKIWYVDDLLIDEAIIHVERIKSDNNYKVKPSQDQRPQGVSPPKAIGKFRYITSLLDGRLYKLEELADKGSENQSGKLELEIIWEDETVHSVIRLHGKLDQNSLDHSFSGSPKNLDKLTYAELWRNLVLASNYGANLTETLLVAWAERGQANLLPVSFNNTSSTERTSMRTGLSIPTPKYSGIGQFNNTVLIDVPLVPLSDVNAEEWAAWLQWEGLNDYQTPATIKRSNEKLKKKFLYHDVCPPNDDVLLDIALEANADPKARFVLAPYDLGLWR